MPDVNVIVEKLKDFGLRHGEKAGVAIASTAFFLCAGLAARMETIKTTPEQIKQATKVTQTNLERPDTRDTILKRLEEKGIKDSDFAKVVDNQVKTALNSDDYKSERDWVIPDPGAGMIRDTPVLIKVTDLYAYPGRGGLLVYALDEEGNRIPETDKDKAQPESARRKRRRRPAGGMGGMMGGSGGARKKKSRSSADIEREQNEELARKKRELARKFVGAEGSDLQDAKAKEDDDATKEAPGKEITKGYRWVAITGKLDHAKLVANYRQALKNAAIAHPNYKRLDLHRQTLQPDGTWSAWELVNSDENLKVLDNMPEEDEELAPESVRPEGLVDPLPFMKAGLWEKVHIASLVPKEKKEIAAPDLPAGGMMGMGGGGSRPMGMGGMGRMMGNMSGSMGSNSGMNSAMGNRMGSMSRGGMMGGMMGGMGGGEAAGNYWKSDATKVMIRALDFTVEPDTTYRYRVRIVVHNPNYQREDVNHGVDTKAKELRGDWSEPSDEVQMPLDVQPYAMSTIPVAANSDVKVQFQVIRFYPDNGWTIPRNFEAGPGEVIGEPRTVDIPVSDGSGKKSRVVDFNSRQIVLDINVIKKTGGFQALPPGMVGAPIDRPALALLLRPDGSVVVRDESQDLANDVRQDIYNNYHHELSQSNKKRKHGVGMGMMGMMGGGSMMGRGSGGMMGGGMGGMR